MYTVGFESLEQQEKQDLDTSPMKWRRSGRDRRLDNFDSYHEEKRGFVGRRMNWFAIASSIIFPRHSKIK